MPEYAVHSVIHTLHIVEADTPEQAAYDVENGECGNGEAVNAGVERVTDVATAGTYYSDLPELRAPVPCTTCGTDQPPGSSPTCTMCWLTQQGADLTPPI